jgi:NADH-quinone oxidoreductase subunit C
VSDVADTEVATEPAPEPEVLHGVPVIWSRDQKVAHPTREQLRDLVQALFHEGYLMCLDVTGVDYLTHPGRELPDGIEAERFEVVVTLISHSERERVRLRVQIPEDDPVCPSLFGIHPGTEAMEREVYDMFGIEFTDHPDMTRILMPEDWVGHPLRKDYDSGRIPVQFKGAPNVR